jgi:hypothetical protein
MPDEINEVTEQIEAPEVKFYQQLSVTIKLDKEEDALAVASEVGKLGEITQLSIYQQRDYGDLPF